MDSISNDSYFTASKKFIIKQNKTKHQKTTTPPKRAKTNILLQDIKTKQGLTIHNTVRVELMPSAEVKEIDASHIRDILAVILVV